MERLLTMDKEQFIRLPHPPPARHQIPKIPPFSHKHSPNSSVYILAAIRSLLVLDHQAYVL